MIIRLGNLLVEPIDKDKVRLYILDEQTKQGMFTELTIDQIKKLINFFYSLLVKEG